MTQPAGHEDTSRTGTPIRPAQPSCEMVLHSICQAVGEQNYQHWFQKRTRLQTTHDRLLIQVPNPFILNWLLKRFRVPLTTAAQQLLGPSGSFQLEVDPSLLNSVESLPGSSQISPTLPICISSAETADALSSAAPSSDSTEKSTAAGGPNRRRGKADQKTGTTAPASTGHEGQRRFRSFATFVSGDCNSLAALAARQVAATPGERFNPLYIHGGTGTGKTHLLEAIYTEVRRRRPQSNVMYLSSEAFTNYFTSALSSRTVPSFRQRFRNVHVLLVDNVEFLDNKRATQEEFLHTIVQVADHGGQVVVSADRHPRMLTKHRDELTTRFMGGLVCRIESPDEDTCRRLVRSLSTGLSATFNDDALEYIARRCRKSVREIQGALNSLDGHFALKGKRITLAVAREVLGDMAQECRRLVRISDVEKVVCEAFGVTASDLRSASRRKSLSLPRSVAMFMSRKLTNSAYREIGLYFGNRDHSTVVAAEKRVNEWIAAGNPVVLPTSCSGRTFAEVVEELETRLMALAS